MPSSDYYTGPAFESLDPARLNDVEKTSRVRYWGQGHRIGQRTGDVEAGRHRCARFYLYHARRRCLRSGILTLRDRLVVGILARRSRRSRS